MTKRNRPELDESSPCIDDQKTLKKSKRKTNRSKNSTDEAIKKQKQNSVDQGPYCSDSSISVLQKKLSDNLAILTPLLRRSCPNNLLRIDSVKNNQEDQPGDRDKSADLRRTSLKSSVRLPRPELISKTSLTTHKHKYKKPSLVAIVSTSQLISRNKKFGSGGLVRNHSSPDLPEPPRIKEIRESSDSCAVPSSCPFAAEFPYVVPFYERVARHEVASGNGSELSLKHLPVHVNTAHSLRLSLFALRQKRGRSFTPLSKLSSSTSSLSAPNTPPTLHNVSVKLQKTSLLPPQGNIVSAPSGWGTFLKGTKGIHQPSSQVGFSKGNQPLDPLTSGTEAVSCDQGLQQSKALNFPGFRNTTFKNPDGETLSLIDKIEKAMNANSKQQIAMTNRKNGQPSMHYQTGRLNPKLSANFSSSFCLPYGLGNRVKSSPVTTPTLPSSSSFHGGPLESLQLMSERASRQQSQYGGSTRQQRKYLERQKMKMLKPLGVNKNQGNMTKLYDISTSEFSAAILPDPTTTSYRLTHDVSFDEGSRYKTTGDFPHNLKGREDVRGHNSPADGTTARANGTLGPPRHEGRVSGGRDHTNNISFKETVPLSLIRMDERFAADLPPATSPSSPALTTVIAAPNSSSAFIPPPSASRQHPSNGTGGSITTFRLHKEKQGWNYRLGELSVNGGGYYSSNSMSSNVRQDLNQLNSLNVSAIGSNQRNSQTRERVVLAPKSRMSSRYSSKAESANAAFPDPCIAAPPSFQQRLTDLSLLESETLKYERNRKLRRKKNQDKDS